MKPNSHEASGEHHGQRPVISMSKLLMRRARHFTVSAVAAFAFLAAATARAQTSVPITLQAPSVYSAQTGMIPNTVVTADFNGDGYLDFAVVEYNPNNPAADVVEIFLGNPDGSFTPSNLYTVGTISGLPYATNHTIGVGHFNGPGGPLGIAVAVSSSTGCATGGVVVIYEAAPPPGSGTVQLCVPNTTPVTSVVVGDFNGDGFDDVAVSNPSGAAAGTTTIFMNGANSTSGATIFYGYASYSVSNLYGTIVPAPNLIEANGQSMALVANTGPFTQDVDVFEDFFSKSGPSGAAFQSGAPISSPPNGFSDILVTDIKGDGQPDIVGLGLRGLAYTQLGVKSGLLSPTLGTLTSVAGSPSGLALATGDFNGDGTPDFAFLNENQNLGITLDPVSASQSILGPFGPVGQGVAAGFSPNLNKWVVIDSGVYQQISPLSTEIPEARSIAVYLLDPTSGQPTPSLPAVYTAPYVQPTGSQPAFAVGDFDGDGRPDVAVLGQDEANFGAVVSIFHNAYGTNTPGYATPPTVLDLGDLGPYGNTQGYALVGGSFRSFDPDIAVVTPEGITLFENQGPSAQGPFNFILDPNCQGYFGAAPNNCYLGNDANFPGLTSSSPRPAIIAADVNGDGYQDIVVAIPENCSATTSSAIYVLLSNGDGTFKAPIYVPSPVADPVGLAAGNLLGTGSNDLVVVNGGEQCGTSVMPANLGAALLPNKHNGTGTFGSPVTIFQTAAAVPAPFVSAVAVADMNLDGTPDVVISANDGVHILLNSKANPGTFTDQGPVPLYSPNDTIINASQIDIADFNDDGAPDVAAAIGGITYVFSGDGNGGLLGPAQGFASGINSGQVRAIDVDGNLSPDMLVSNSQGFSVVINSGSAQAPPGSPAHLVLVANVTSLGPFTTSSPISAGFILQNQGPGSATHVKVTITLPSGLEFVSGGTTNFPCTSVSATQAVCSITAFALEAESPAIPLVFEATQTGSFTVSLTATSDEAEGMPTSDASANLAVTVGSGSSITVTVSPSSVILMAGQSQQFTAVVTGTTTTSVTWSVTPPTGCGTINLTGLYQALSISVTCLVTATSIVPGGGSASATVQIIGGAPPPASPVITSISPANGTQGQQGLQVTITGSNFVAGATTVTFGGGTAGITVTSLTVNSATSATATLNIAATTALGNYDVALTVTGASNPATLTGGFSIAPVTINISETIMVNDQPFVTQVLAVAAPYASYSNGSLGFASQPTQTLTLSNGGQQPLIIASVAFSNPAFALGPISCSTPSSSIVTTIPSGGSCLLTITYASNSGGSATGTLMFTDNAAASNVNNTQSGASYIQSVGLDGAASTNGAPISQALVSITITPSTPTVNPGSTQQFTAMGLFSNGSTSDITNSVAWSSSTPAVATISNATGSQGLATAISAGDTTITATSGTISATTLLIVPIFISETITVTDEPSVAAGLSATQISVTASGLLYSRVTKAYSGTVTITNTSGNTLSGPFQLVLTGLTSGATLTNATGSYNGSPYISVTSPAGLAAKQAVGVTVLITYGGSAKITFTPVVYSGTF